MPYHAMLDLETLSLQPNAVIFQIGVRLFDDTFALGDSLSLRLDVIPQIMAGHHIDVNTVNWWKAQSAAVDFAKLGKDRILHPLDALTKLRAFFVTNGVREVWANSPAADCVWVNSLLSSYELSPIWSHKQERDMRTIVNFGRSLGIEYAYPRPTVHEAVADCDDQIAAIAFFYGMVQEVVDRANGHDK